MDNVHSADCGDGFMLRTVAKSYPTVHFTYV